MKYSNNHSAGNNHNVISNHNSFNKKSHRSISPTPIDDLNLKDKSFSTTTSTNTKVDNQSLLNSLLSKSSFPVDITQRVSNSNSKSSTIPLSRSTSNSSVHLVETGRET